MGYQDAIFKAACVKCDSKVIWKWKLVRLGPLPREKFPQWECRRCSTVNAISNLDPWPPLPRDPLYIGCDKYKVVKLYPFPPDYTKESWATPFSIRSVFYQASRQLGGCIYHPSKDTEVMGKPVFSDQCHDEEDDPRWGLGPCHMVSGWTKGQSTCSLWEKFSTLCQRDTERTFLHQYLRFVKDREFPMLIPQVRMGIAERRRPDFVLFIPLQYWKYKWLAIELDNAHGEEMAEEDELRDMEIALHGYEVIRLKPGAKGYLHEVQWLVEMVEGEMSEAESDSWGVAVQAPAHEVEEGPPF